MSTALHQSLVIKGKNIPITCLWGPGFQIPWHRHLKVVGCQSYTPAVFTLRSILVLIFRRLSRPRAHGIVGCHGKNPQWHHRESIPGPSD
jgi:hypothetical protein